MMRTKFGSLVDEALFVAERFQHGTEPRPISLKDFYLSYVALAASDGTAPAKANIELLGPDLERRGFGKFIGGPGLDFEINGAGITHVQSQRSQRERGVISRFVNGLTRSDLIAILALAVSVFK